MALDSLSLELSKERKKMEQERWSPPYSDTTIFRSKVSFLVHISHSTAPLHTPSLRPTHALGTTSVAVSMPVFATKMLLEMWLGAPPAPPCQLELRSSGKYDVSWIRLEVIVQAVEPPS